MKRFHRLYFLLAVLLAGCSTGPQPGQPTAAQTGPTRAPAPIALTPYHSPTPGPSAAVSARTPTAIPTPTPTPRSYTVVRGDDMFGIALRHGVPLDLIMTANPTVDPNFLSIGTVLQIPYAEITPTPGQASPTPVKITVSQPACYSSADGGAWCFLTVHNPGDRRVENLAGSLVLSGAGDSLFSAEAVPFLDSLPVGQQMPLAGYFPEAPRPFAANGTLQSAVFVPAGDARYLPASASGLNSDIRPDGLSAAVSGSVSLETGSPAATRVAVLAVAYAASGSPAGARKLELTGPLQPGGSLPFQLLVYSLGPPIERVEILVEARP